MIVSLHMLFYVRADRGDLLLFGSWDDWAHPIFATDVGIDHVYLAPVSATGAFYKFRDPSGNWIELPDRPTVGEYRNHSIIADRGTLRDGHTEMSANVVSMGLLNVDRLSHNPENHRHRSGDHNYLGTSSIYVRIYFGKAMAFEGWQVDGLMHGWARQFWNTGGIRAEGEWHCGKLDGSGTSYREDGSIEYQGAWRNGCRHGDGTSFRADGTREYLGAWQNGCLHGYGTSFRVDGTKEYQGSWQNGSRHGKGVAYRENGREKYDGDWQNGDMHGNGCLYLENGKSRYEGSWRNGQWRGKGDPGCGAPVTETPEIQSPRDDLSPATPDFRDFDTVKNACRGSCLRNAVCELGKSPVPA
ncbi:MAG: MORN repeat-containing protein [Sulfobacillus sp.]